MSVRRRGAPLGGAAPGAPAAQRLQHLLHDRSTQIFLLQIGVLMALLCLSTDLGTIQSALVKQSNVFARIGDGRLYQWLPLGGSTPPNGDLCDPGQGRGGGTSARLGSSSEAANPCLPDRCRPDEYTAWDDWKACKALVLETAGWSPTTDEAQRAVAQAMVPQNVSAANAAADRSGNGSGGNGDSTTATNPSSVKPLTAVEAFIVEHREHMAWQNSTFTAVLPEFRFFEQPVTFVLNNVLDNLPVNWRVQIFAGPTMCNGVRRLFPVEVAAGKIVLTDVGDRDYDHAHINVLYTDLEDLYGRLLGDTWLFFQLDSVICSKQRHLLKHFIETKRGWWGAPWDKDHWEMEREPMIGGNGGFSLRSKRFIYTILERFPWKWGEPWEDKYFAFKAFEIYDELPDDLKPATFEEEKAFSSELHPVEAPFAVHKFWYYQGTGSMPMFATCPEMWGLLPPPELGGHWAHAVCAADVRRADFVKDVNIRFDFDEVCDGKVPRPPPPP